jgi:hypothetical protein
LHLERSRSYYNLDLSLKLADLIVVFINIGISFVGFFNFLLYSCLFLFGRLVPFSVRLRHLWDWNVLFVLGLNNLRNGVVQNANEVIAENEVLHHIKQEG